MKPQEVYQVALGWLRRHAKVRDATFLVQNVMHAMLPSHTSSTIAPGQRYGVSILTRVKDEGRFLPEWVAHHYLMGVEHFYIYDNGSTDGTTDRLRPFVERGIVTVIDWPTAPVSPAAERHFLRNFARSTEWVAFLDADEYMIESSRGGFLELLANANHWPAVALNWRYFGSSGHEAVPSGLLYANFSKANERFNRHIKVVAKTSAIHRTRNSHNFYYRGGRLARTFSGRRVLASFSDPALADDAPVTINHYVYRSRQDARRKVHRGFVDRQGELDRARRESQVEADFYSNNAVEVSPDSAWIVKLQTYLTELGYPKEFTETQ